MTTKSVVSLLNRYCTEYSNKLQQQHLCYCGAREKKAHATDTLQAGTHPLTPASSQQDISAVLPITKQTLQHTK